VTPADLPDRDFREVRENMRDFGRGMDVRYRPRKQFGLGVVEQGTDGGVGKKEPATGGIRHQGAGNGLLEDGVKVRSGDGNSISWPFPAGLADLVMQCLRPMDVALLSLVPQSRLLHRILREPYFPTP